MFVVARRLALVVICCGMAASASTAFAQDNCNGGCEPRWHSDAWWAMRANEPVGARQCECKGLQWPPYPRPVGPPMTCAHIYHAEHYWPWPYLCTDRQVVLDMTRTQEANGWISETTLYEYYFNPDTNDLTTPGKTHLRWILDYAPASYRSVWIQQVDDPAASQQRMNAVRLAATQIAGGNNLPPIQFRVAMPPSRPAVEADTIRRKELQTIPTPRIPLPQSAAGASSTAPGVGGGGGGGGGGAGY
ncbi:MAG TPA: hypothetical protein VGP63_03075 [Planctomycetaceae bacterium]|nr:hypothetical protein [Planctomycetaceae bacterium]